MTVIKHIGLLALAIGVISVGGSTRASLITQLDGPSSPAEVDVIARLEGSDLGSRVDMSLKSSTSSRNAHADLTSEARRKNLSKLPGLVEHRTTSSAATSTPHDSGSVGPVLTNQVLLLPIDLDIGPVSVDQALVPPDPPPTGLLKPPRARIEATFLIFLVLL